MILGDILPPEKFRLPLSLLQRVAEPKILDVGCGNHSPTATRKWFPQCVYHGVDIVEDYNLNEADKKAMQRFIKVEPDGGGYEQIENGAYDFLVMNHVLEHMPNAMEILDCLLEKLRPGAVVYLAFPSERSLQLPSAQGTLHFCDDSTHVFVPSVREITNLLLSRGFTIVRAGQSKNPVRWWIGALVLPFRWVQRALTGRMSAKGLWYVLGFEASVIAVKK